MLLRGELDALVTLDSFGKPGEYVPAFKIGQSDFYFAVSNKCPDLLEDLNSALYKIQGADRAYNQSMYDKYISQVGVNTYIDREEADWLAKHGTIRIGYRDNYMPFCGTDSGTGELTGALKDFLELASTAAFNAGFEYSAVPYPTVKAALDALQNGDVDCIFPVSLSPYDEQ